MTAPVRIAVRPGDGPAWLMDAVRAAGAAAAPPQEADGLIWYGHDPGELQRLLDSSGSIRWVQIAWAGVEAYRPLMNDGRTWTCAKSVYGENVAEHALALILASFREVPRLARTRRWTEAQGARLYNAQVTVVGAGGITTALLGLLRPFRVSATVVRRHPSPVQGADRVISTSSLDDGLASADVVVLACALTPETSGLMGERQFRAMGSHALIVNVARGGLVRTDDLVAALRAGEIGGAALDVTDPEPLPEGHPLWSLDNVLITPHAANPDRLGRMPLTWLVRENVLRFAAGRPLLGLVDTRLGY